MFVFICIYIYVEPLVYVVVTPLVKNLGNRSRLESLDVMMDPTSNLVGPEAPSNGRALNSSSGNQRTAPGNDPET